jgi:hypothetical protein
VKKLVFVVALLAGCAPAHYVKNDITPDQAAQDRQECIYEAERAAAPIYDAITRQIRINDLVGSCLEARGYRRG